MRTVTATDLANVFGTPPGIDIVKLVNGDDADSPADASYALPVTTIASALPAASIRTASAWPLA